jgi:ABC-type nitrate/sulfonate/bicarbonate transport system substrate-binding protein
MGTDVNGRAAALASGRVEATLLTAPQYFKLEQAGYKNLANLADHDDLFAATTYLMKKSVVAADPALAERLLQAHAEAIRRFYQDKDFALKAYLAYDHQPRKMCPAFRTSMPVPICSNASPTCCRAPSRP